MNYRGQYQPGPANLAHIEKGPDGLRTYMDEKNRLSLDGLPALDLDPDS